MKQAELIWMNGDFVPWDEAKVHVLTHGLHYGTGVANPLAMILSAAMMLRHGFGMESEAARVELAVDAALEDGLRTRDLGGDATTAQATDAVLNKLERTYS